MHGAIPVNYSGATSHVVHKIVRLSKQLNEK